MENPLQILQNYLGAACSPPDWPRCRQLGHLNVGVVGCTPITRHRVLTFTVIVFDAAYKSFDRKSVVEGEGGGSRRARHTRGGK